MPTVSEFSAAQYYDQIYNEGGIDIDQANSVLQQIEELAGDEVCCICYEPTADMISPFTCGHHLHRACVMGQLASGRTFACPLCRNTMRTESSNDRISTMPVVDNIERVIPEEASTLSSLLTDVVRPNEGSNAENRELLNRQTEILEDFNVTDDYSASELENPQDLINNAFERIINNIRETHPKGIFRRRMTNAQKEILRQERENLVNQLLVIMNRASPLYNITNDRTEILSNLSEQLTQDRAQIELLSRRLFHEVSRLDREITEQRDSQVSQADQVNQAENEQIQGLILALEEAVTSRFSEIERRLLDQESNNPQSASISNECDNQTSGVPEITRRFDELQSSVIDADNSMNNRLTEIERRLNQQTESTQNEQSQVVSETPLSNEKEAELNQKIDQLQSTVNRLLQQINRNTTNSASRSDRALDRPQPKALAVRIVVVF